MQNMAMPTMNQHIRNIMSVMAWGMAALCAWVMVLSVHVLADAARGSSEVVYPTVTVSVPEE